VTFKDHVARDIGITFFNTDEFSDSVIIDDQTCTVQIDSDRLIERSEKEYDGITQGLILYFIPVSEYPVNGQSDKPKVGNSQVFNNKYHLIDSVAESDGVYEIVINQNRGE
jgi:hypothetical protein